MTDRATMAGLLRQSHHFRLLFAAQTVSRWGDTFNAIALVILVYRLTGSGTRVAGTVALEVVPVLLFGFVAGSVVDRWPRRHVMIAADLGRAVIAIALAVLAAHVAAAYLAAFGLSALSVFFNPAAATVLPTVVDEDQLLTANSVLWSAAVVSQIVLAPVAGALVVTAGPGPAFVLNAVSFVTSAALLVRLPDGEPATTGATGHRSDIRAGLAAIWDDRFLRVLAGAQVLAALSAGMTSALLVVLAGQHLHVGAQRFGLLLAGIGFGAAVGPILLRRLVDDVRRRRFIFGPYLLRGTVDLLLAATSKFGVALAALGIYGLGTSTGMVTYTSVLQLTVPDRLRGRVFAFFDVVWQSGRLVSILIGGFLADALGITAVYWIGGVLLIGAGIFGFCASDPAMGKAA